MRPSLTSLRRLILGETWTIPLGVGAALGLGVVMRAWLPHNTWQATGGFCLSMFVLAVLAFSLRRAQKGHS